MDATMTAALKAVRAQHPAWLVCAVPMASPQSLAQVRRFAADVVCLATPSPSGSTSQHFRNLEAIDDATMVTALARPGGMYGSRHGDFDFPASGHRDA